MQYFDKTTFCCYRILNSCFTYWRCFMITIGYTDADFSAMEKTASFKELVPIAMQIINRICPPVGFVCGPISAAGGTKSVKRNTEIFQSHIEFLERKGLKIFNQLPFEKTLWRILAEGKNESNLLKDFYQPLFDSGAFNIFYFIPGWESSYGASWEFRKAQELEITIIHL